MFSENVKTTNLLIKLDVLCGMCGACLEYILIFIFQQIGRYLCLQGAPYTIQHIAQRTLRSFKFNFYVSREYGHLKLQDISSVYAIIAPSIIQHTLSRR